jgi:hypothetical protein
LDKSLHTKILSEIAQIDKLLELHQALIDGTIQKEPDTVELSALAMLLHSFYNGIEKICTLPSPE